jgi:hypothetical protein
MTNADADLKVFLSLVNAARAEKMKELDREAFATQCNWRAHWLDQSLTFHTVANEGGGRIANGNVASCPICKDEGGGRASDSGHMTGNAGNMFGDGARLDGRSAAVVFLDMTISPGLKSVARCWTRRRRS